MAIVVEPTIPFPAADLDLQNASTWNHLLPLIRPSVQAIQTKSGHSILLDTSLLRINNVHIVAVQRPGNFSSTVLDNRRFTAVVSEADRNDALRAEAIADALHSAGVSTERGIVVVRAGKTHSFHIHGPNLIEVETKNELEQDHVLHLLSSLNSSCRASIQQVTDVLTQFAQNARTAHAKFHTEIVDGNPALIRDDGVSGYEEARHAVEQDLRRVLEECPAEKDRVYSVHYSDVNGLSRLENYLVAGEIGRYLDSQNLPYTLSHSTIQDHTETGRSWYISIAPVPVQSLAAQARSKEVTKDVAGDGPSAMVSPTSAKMNFDDGEVRRRIEAGCHAVIEEEPLITKYDTIVGDGDCGYTLRDGAKQVLRFIRDQDLTRLPDVVERLVSELGVSMGGTSGALYCIYLTALAAALAKQSTIAAGLAEALQQLMKYTKARVGDRTMMDALIPFVETLSGGGDVQTAIEECRKGVEGTMKMEARLGRSTYLDEKATEGTPDPGAYGLLVLLQAMATA